MRTLCYCLPLLLCSSLWGQLGINTETPNPRSLLDISHTTGIGQGLLIPRLTTSERESMLSGSGSLAALDNSDNSMLVYDSEKEHFYSYLANTIGFTTVTATYTNIGDQEKWQITNPWRTVYYNEASSGNTITNISLSPVVNGNVGIGLASDLRPDEKLHVAGTIKSDENIIAIKNMTADTIGTKAVTTLEGFGTVPVGGIIMWNGDPTSLPDGWEICNGGTYTWQGTTYSKPDLRGRFVVGYDGSDTDYDNVNTTGPDYAGTDYEIVNQGKQIKLNIGSIPAHNHTIEDFTGKHRHDFDIDFNILELREHQSRVYQGIDVEGVRIRRNSNSNTTFKYQKFVAGQEYIDNITGFYHTALLDQTYKLTPSGLLQDGGHSHDILDTGGSQAHENRPPYYVLAYIIRTK